MKCLHWGEAAIRGGGKCSLMGKTVSYGVCRDCRDNTDPCEWPPASPLLQRARIGTHIKTTTAALGLKPCGGCNKRAQLPNGDSIST